jgi:hypothetical protein
MDKILAPVVFGINLGLLQKHAAKVLFRKICNIQSVLKLHLMQFY